MQYGSKRNYLYNDPNEFSLYDMSAHPAQAPVAQAPKQDMTGDMVQNTTAGAAMGGPAGAAVMAGGTFLNSYLQAKAAEEQQKRALMVQAAQQQGQGEQNALSNLIQVAGRFRA